MRVELEIPDRLWADFCLWLSEGQAGCACAGNPSRHLQHILAMDMAIINMKKFNQRIADDVNEGRIGVQAALQLQEIEIADMARDYGITQ